MEREELNKDTNIRSQVLSREIYKKANVFVNVNYRRLVRSHCSNLYLPNGVFCLKETQEDRRPTYRLIINSKSIKKWMKKI